MSPHFELFVDPIREILQTFERDVELGAQVDGDDNKRIVLDLEELGDNRDIFNTTSKITDFVSLDVRFKAAIDAYFVGGWHPDDVFGKYIVHDGDKDTDEVRDSAQMKIDNNNIKVDLVTEPTVRAGSAVSVSSHGDTDYVSSSESERSDGSLPEIAGAAGGKKKRKTPKKSPD
jgi:hypothetical protein